jgi:hypothetical protein
MPENKTVPNHLVFGFQTGDIVRADVPVGVNTGTHIGRLGVSRTVIAVGFIVQMVINTRKENRQFLRPNQRLGSLKEGYPCRERLMMRNVQRFPHD